MAEDTRPPDDLHTQLEELLNEVRAGERNWRLDDKIDLALNKEKGPDAMSGPPDPPTPGN